MGGSRIVLLIATVALSFTAFVIFNFAELSSFFDDIRSGTLSRDSETIAFEFFQSVYIFVTGLFFTFFLSRFDRVSERLYKVADEVPSIVRTEVTQITKPVEERFDKLTKELAHGVISQGNKVYRALEYDQTSGVLKNHTSNDARAPRNILMNVNTVMMILGAIEETGTDHLRRVGYRCGRAFLYNLQNIYAELGNDFDKTIHLWLEYDANAGFGKFVLDRRLVDDSSPPLRIFLQHNFLMENLGSRPPEQDLNYFMEGYLTGVFSAFPVQTIRSAGFRSGRIKVVYEPHRATDGEVIYSPDIGSSFSLYDDV